MQAVDDAVSGGDVPLAWEDRREGCWHGLRNGRVIASVMFRPDPDGEWHWSIRGVNPFGVAKTAGREDSREGGQPGGCNGSRTGVLGPLVRSFGSDGHIAPA